MSGFHPHNRHSIRVTGYDYSLVGVYFVTIVTHKRKCLFGEIVNSDNIPNPYGEIAFDQWMRLRNRFPNSDFSNFVIMPNHIHGLVSINLGAGDFKQNSHVQIPPLRPYAIYKDSPSLLGTIIRAYKLAVTYRINAMRGITSPHIWQRNYYEHVIRNDKDYESIYKYIESNPSNWNADQLHPSVTTDSNSPSSSEEA